MDSGHGTGLDMPQSHSQWEYTWYPGNYTGRYGWRHRKHPSDRPSAQVVYMSKARFGLALLPFNPINPHIY